MQCENDHRPWNVRALPESTRTPFAVARYQPGAAIVFQGDACDSVMHIENGRVLLAVTAASGKEAICGLLGSGGLLGEEVLGSRPVRRQTATALTSTEVLVVAKGQMTRLLHTEQAIADRFIAHVLARHLRLEDDLADQLLHSSEQRLARMLLLLAACGERHLRRCPIPDVSQDRRASSGRTRTSSSKIRPGNNDSAWKV